MLYKFINTTSNYFRFFQGHEPEAARREGRGGATSGKTQSEKLSWYFWWTKDALLVALVLIVLSRSPFDNCSSRVLALWTSLMNWANFGLWTDLILACELTLWTGLILAPSWSCYGLLTSNISDQHMNGPVVWLLVYRGFDGRPIKFDPFSSKLPFNPNQ